MVETINHIGYRTDDLAAAIRFYRATFGAEVYEELQGEDGTRYAFLRLGAATVELIEPADRAALGGRTGLLLDHVAYQVADMGRAIETLTARGVRFTTPAPAVAPDGLQYITLDAGTTAGTRIQLVQPAPDGR
jgi:catechol 2,3-dioxygenase-like lactoylglutathione lyase family enzyme